METKYQKVSAVKVPALCSFFFLYQARVLMAAAAYRRPIAGNNTDGYSLKRALKGYHWLYCNDVNSCQKGEEIMIVGYPYEKSSPGLSLANHHLHQ